MEKNILERLNKLKELAERGIEGEAENAKRFLNKELLKYNMTLEDLLTSKEEKHKRTIKYSSHFEKVLLIQCMVFLFGSNSEVFANAGRYRNGKMEIHLEISDLDFILLDDFFNFHKKCFKEELLNKQEKLFQAYLNVNDLYDSAPKEEQSKSKKKKVKFSFSDLLEISSMSSSMEKKIYNKKLNS